MLTNYKYDPSGHLVQKGVTAVNGAREVVDYGHHRQGLHLRRYGPTTLPARCCCRAATAPTARSNRPRRTVPISRRDQQLRSRWAADDQDRVWSNNMKDVYQYNVKGQNYTSNHVVYDASARH